MAIGVRLPRHLTSVLFSILLTGLIASTSSRLTPYALYVTIFFVGVALARVFRLKDLWNVPSASGAIALAVVVLLLTWRWTRGGLEWHSEGLPESLLAGLDTISVVLGATLAIWASLQIPAWSKILGRQFPQWLGSRSYSLYLVHEPILVAFSFVVGGRPSPWGLLIIAIPTAALAAEAFYQLVEKPSIRAAAAAGSGALRILNRRRGELSM